MLTLGRTLMGNPELLLVDEPTEGLSPQMTDLVLDMIQPCKRKGMPSFWWNIPWISLSKWPSGLRNVQGGNCLGGHQR